MTATTSTKPADHPSIVELRNDAFYITDAERHGSPRDLATVWFAAQLHLAPVVIGGIGVGLGLGLWSTLLAMTLANVMGVAVLATTCAMGPRVGVPQMVLGRVPFGYFGNYLPAALTWMLGIGWFAVNAILAALAAVELLGVPYLPAAIVLTLSMIIITAVGYRLVHLTERYFTLLGLLAFGAVFVLLLINGLGPAQSPSVSFLSGEYLALFFLIFTIELSYALSWVPYAADYSRYLPKETPMKAAWGYSYAGGLLGMMLVNVLGALLATLAIEGGIVPAIGVATGALAPFIYVVVILGSVAANVINAYSGAMSGLVCGLRLSRRNSVYLIGAVGMALTLFFGGERFAESFQAYLFLIVYWIAPWAGIIVIDFFLFHRSGRTYRTEEFYTPKYGLDGVRMSGFSALLIGIVISIPFMSSPLFTGPIAEAVGGADFSYIVSFFISAGLYLKFGRPREEAGSTGSARPVT